MNIDKSKPILFTNSKNCRGCLQLKDGFNRKYGDNWAEYFNIVDMSAGGIEMSTIALNHRIRSVPTIVLGDGGINITGSNVSTKEYERLEAVILGEQND